jgi:hypothetical protein
MVLMGYSRARGTLIYEKNLMSKISRQTPFEALNFSGLPNKLKTFQIFLTVQCLCCFGQWIKYDKKRMSRAVAMKKVY